jgi:hypothetical protein
MTLTLKNKAPKTEIVRDVNQAGFARPITQVKSGLA